MLPKLSTLILGFFQEGEKNPYEIKKLYNELEMSKWFPIADSSIYATVTKLKRQGLIEGKEVKGENSPKKTVYKITPKGEEELRNTVASYFEEPDYEFSKFEVGVLLMDLLSKEEIMKKLKALLSSIDKKHYEVKKQILSLEQSSHTVSIATIAVFKNKLHLLDAERKTINDLIRALNTRRGRRPNRTAFDLRAG